MLFVLCIMIKPISKLLQCTMTQKTASTDLKPMQSQEWMDEWSDASQKIFESAMQAYTEMFKGSSLDPFNIASTYMDMVMGFWQNPAGMVKAQQRYMSDSLKLWQYTTSKLMGGDGAAPVIEPERGDNRWRDEEWNQNLVFDYIKQSYLLAARCVEDTLEEADHLEEKEAKRLSFFAKQFVNAMSPTNYPTTNPEVLRATLEKRGENLLQGLQNFVRDMEEGDGQLRIAMTDTEAFKVGENVATTPGKVVFQNRLFQLIQYSPSTDEVYKRPLLISPPWINKFYILDLQPKNSMVKWLVDQGHTVFVISWINPDEEHYKDVGFDTYMLEGIYAAVDAVEKITGESEIDMVGYCIAGTLLSATLSHMKAHGDKRIATATFFTALIDFEEPGDLGVFLSDDQIAKLESDMEATGFLSGRSMSNAFNMLRSNDLIWSFYINNYLLGKDPAVFDLLYWNSDATNLPAKMHSFYLRKMYLENKLCVPKGISLDDVAIDVSTIDVPSYFISAKEDHIAPWKSTYAGAKLFSGEVKYVLGGSGHIAGIVNPPIKNKYGYWTGSSAELPESPDAWLDQAEQHEGSWWNNWDQWLIAHNNEKVPAREPGKGKSKSKKYQAIEDAPGSYVAKRI